MAPGVEEVIADAMTSGQLTIRAGKARSIERSGSVALVIPTARKFGYGNPHRGLHAHQSDPAQYDQSGAAQPVRQRACQARSIGGPAWTYECALVGQSGEPSTQIFAIGPLTRTTFWEINAFPDIRAQCHPLTAHIAPSCFRRDKPARTHVAPAKRAGSGRP
jgi:uncharacterized NAD(P)/FAD-binding protein YdhS